MNSRIAVLLSVIVLTLLAPRKSLSSRVLNFASFQRSSNSSLILGNVPQGEVRSKYDCASRCAASYTSRCDRSPACRKFCYSVTSKLCYLSATSQLFSYPVSYNDSEHFVCYDAVTPVCPLTLGYLQVRGQCVKLYEEVKQHAEAESRCEEDGGHLYYYSDLTTDEPVIVDLLNVTGTNSNDFWVGASRMTSGEYRWLSGCLLSDSDPVWMSVEPNRGADEYCVHLRNRHVPQGSWRLNDISCQNPLQYFCQIDV